MNTRPHIQAQPTIEDICSVQQSILGQLLSEFQKTLLTLHEYAVKGDMGDDRTTLNDLRFGLGSLYGAEIGKLVELRTEAQRMTALRDQQPPKKDELPQDVIDLVVAARQLLDVSLLRNDQFNALDRAVGAFSERVPYEDEPTAEELIEAGYEAGEMANVG